MAPRMAPSFFLKVGISKRNQTRQPCNMMPLGPSGKVKLAAKHSDAAKEVRWTFAENIIR